MTLLRQHHLHSADIGPCVVTLGNFDGVHRGHQHLLQQCKVLAEQESLPIVAIVFEPQPREFFKPQAPQQRLMGLKDKYCSLRRHGVHTVLCLRFNTTMAEMTAAAFLHHILQTGLQARHLVVGHDVALGYQREGNADWLGKHAKNYGITLHIIDPLLHQAARVSSTAIREHLSQGCVLEANALLGYRYSVQGRVVHGAKRGARLGFPTANLHVYPARPYLTGIFVVEIEGVPGGKPLGGVANIGVSPMYNGGKWGVEANIFDWEGDLYGKTLQVCLIEKIREEQMFSSENALIEQMHKDVEQARFVYKNTK